MEKNKKYICNDCNYVFKVPFEKHNFFKIQCNKCGSNNLKWIL